MIRILIKYMSKKNQRIVEKMKGTLEVYIFCYNLSNSVQNFIHNSQRNSEGKSLSHQQLDFEHTHHKTADYAYGHACEAAPPVHPHNAKNCLRNEAFAIL